MRGGEKVLEAICGLYPDAPLYSLVHARGQVSPAIERHRVRTSFVQRLPGAVRRYRQFLPLFPAAVELFDLDGFDVCKRLRDELVTRVEAHAPETNPAIIRLLETCGFQRIDTGIVYRRKEV